MFFTYISVGCGGALGAIARVALSRLLPATFIDMPIQILCINVLGCLIMGLLAEGMALYWDVPENMRFFLVSGFLGGFTTFSAFALEFGLLVEKGHYFSAISYATLSFVLSIVAFFSGVRVLRFWS